MSSGIIIIGPSGSGKTTLGKIAARKLGYPYFDVDDYIWKQNTDSPYTQIVMAGSMSSFHYAFDEMFEMMVLLYVSPDIRIERVHKRAIARFGERVLEGGDMYEAHMRFLNDNRRYEEDGSPNMREQKEWMENMSCVKIELDGAAELEKNADKERRYYCKQLEWDSEMNSCLPVSFFVDRLALRAQFLSRA